MNIYYQNPATVHMQVWYIQRFSDRLRSIWLEQMKRNGWLKTQHLRTTSSMQSSRFQGQISTSIYFKVTRKSSYLETTNQFQKFERIITNAWGIPLRALPAEYWKAVFAWWHSISKHKQAKKTFSDFYTKQHLQMTCNCSQKNNSN